ncbi:MAG: FAD-dependent monooxygenase [Betaproteobacteria bacterium]
MSNGRVIVAGAGPVGLAFACACRGLDVHVVDPAPRGASPGEGFDVRVFALSAGTRTFLRDIEAWERIDPARIAAVRRMEIFGDGSGKLAFSGRAGMPLAWIAEANRLSAALEEQAATLPGVSVTRGQRVASCVATEARARVDLENGTSLEGDLLVGADGPDSAMRAMLGLESSEVPYAETAVVANFATEQGHGDVARQWFRKDGVLAWLPLPGKRMSIVWSAPTAVAEELAALDTRAFERRVREAGGAMLGDLELISVVARFPLRSIRVQRTVAPGAALIGDAAHAVHPLAGQGVNLGFQDARVLAEELGERSPLERPGDLRVLRRYARQRREDVTAMQFVTDRLDKLFASEVPGASAVRNTGLDLVERMGWIKNTLAGRAMR